MKLDTVEVLAAARRSPALALAARFWAGKVRLGIGAASYVLEVDRGEIVSFEASDDQSADISVVGPYESWTNLLQRIPPPGFHDPLYNDGRSKIEVHGDYVGNIAPYGHVVQELISVIREVVSGPKTDVVVPEVDRDHDATVGRYMYVRIQGVQYRIYYEESGEGDIPLLLQHMAGSDGRTWRHLLEDAECRKLFRMIAYDLPFHGRSLPPPSQAWWEKPYKLTRDFLMDAVIAISSKLALDRPVYMGGSLGGMLAADLAFYHPDAFRAVIGINAALAAPLDEQQWEKVRTLSNPKVGSHWNGTLNYANSAPTSPEAYRREVTWIYTQGVPSIMEGDMNYYGLDHSLTAQEAATIDTSKVAVYLLSSGYDFTATEYGTALLANAIKGCYFRILPSLGHFGLAENPDGFQPALLEVLRNIATGEPLTS
jgi:pimeloyl-ACP methyl ester carboxylesterase